MRISSLQENLKQGLFAVGHIAGKNINLPILNNVMIEARDGNIKLISTNLEIGVVSAVRGKIEEEGSITVDAKTISDYVSLLPNKKINIKQKDNNLIIEADNYKTKIIGQPADDYPLIPEIKKEEYYEAEISEFRRALAQTIFAVSANESRLELSGVLFDFGGKSLVLAATDSYRLAEKTIQVKTNASTEENKKIIIPARALQELLRILSAEQNEDENSEIKFYLSENQILFTVGSIELVSRLIEGQYPDYKQIIPDNAKTSATINKQNFVRAVKASSLFSKTGVNDINLDFPKGKNMAIVSSASGQTGENVTEVDAEVSGDDNGVTVNYRYLLDGLNNIEGEDIKVEVIDPNTPCVLRPEKENDYLYIIMPIKQ